MSRIYKDSETMSKLRIRPEGWTQDLVFDVEGFGMCGQAEAGIGIELSGERGGGVLTLDDLLAIQKLIAHHFSKISKAVEGDKSLGSEYNDFADNEKVGADIDIFLPQDNPFQLPYRHTNSKGVTYILNKKEVELRGGKSQMIYYFSKDLRPEACDLPIGYSVMENPRNGFLTVKRIGTSTDTSCDDEGED